MEDPSSSRGPRLPAPRSVVGAAVGTEGGAGRPAPANPRPRPPAFPTARAPAGRRSPGAVAGRGVQGALWPSGAGGRSSHGDAGGFRGGSPPAAPRSSRRSLAPWLRLSGAPADPRGCGGPGARCGSRAPGLSNSGDLSPCRSGEASRRRLGSMVPSWRRLSARDDFRPC